MLRSHSELSGEPPAPIRRVSSGVVQLRAGGGCLSIFGLPFLLAGVFLSLAITGIVRMDNTPQELWARALLVVMSVTFVAVGSTLLFGRRWLLLDIDSRTAARVYGMMVPMWERRRGLDEFSAVAVDFQRGDSDTPECYPVCLRAIAGRDSGLCAPAQFAASHTIAAFLSAFVKLPLADNTSDREVIVAPDRADETLQQRLRSMGSHSVGAADYQFTHCHVSVDGDAVTVIVPHRASRWPAIVAAGCGVLVLLLFAPALWRFLLRTDTPAGIRAVLMGSVVLLFGILPLISMLLGLRRTARQTVITASPAGVTIERTRRRRTEKTFVAAAKILDLDCRTFGGMVESGRRAVSRETPHALEAEPRLLQTIGNWLPTGGIVLKSLDGLMTFGEGLPVAELERLKSVLTKALAGGIKPETVRH